MNTNFHELSMNATRSKLMAITWQLHVKEMNTNFHALDLWSLATEGTQELSMNATRSKLMAITWQLYVKDMNTNYP